MTGGSSPATSSEIITGMGNGKISCHNIMKIFINIISFLPVAYKCIKNVNNKYYNNHGIDNYFAADITILVF